MSAIYSVLDYLDRPLRVAAALYSRHGNRGRGPVCTGYVGIRVDGRVSAFGVLGGYAERVAVPVANVVRSPAELDDAEAVSLLVHYNTMYFAALFSGSPGQLVSFGLKPRAPQRYPLSRAQAALQCLADGGVLGSSSLSRRNQRGQLN